MRTTLATSTATISLAAMTALVVSMAGLARTALMNPPLARRRVAWRDDRGDVPGWVLVTVMTAGLVIALWAAAQPALSTMFTTAVNSVKGPGG